MSEFPFLKKFKIKRRKEIEPQEVFLDSLAQKREQETGISEKKFEVPLSSKLIWAIFFIFFAGLFFLAVQSFYLQIVQNKEFSLLSDQNKYALDYIKAERGVVYDSSGEQLVFNRPSFDLVASKNDLPQETEARRATYSEISRLTGISVPEIEEKILSSTEKATVIIENIDHQKLVLLTIALNKLTGFEIKKTSTRNYKDGYFYSHLIGYVGKINETELKENPGYLPQDYIGKEGIERSFESYLKEKSGKIQIERDVYGNPLSEKVASLPQSGESLVLWLDASLQKKASEELQKTLEKTGAKKGAVVALNPKTGGVLALLSLPSYDNNLFTRGADQNNLKEVFTDPLNPLFNRSIAGLYPTGSTIKPLLSAAALQENLIDPDKDISCQGAITVKNQYNPEIVYTHKDNAVHGATDMRKAIAESCNVYFFTIGGGYGAQKGLGPTRIKSYLELFGWGEKTNVDVPGEEKGFIPSPPWKKEAKGLPWTDGDTYNISIGQGDLLITPLQVATAFSAIANGGTLYKPQTVKQILDENKDIIKEIEPEIIRSEISDPEILRIVREGMRMAVTGKGAPQASSVILNSLPVATAAKTGTAETPYKKCLSQLDYCFCSIRRS